MNSLLVENDDNWAADPNVTLSTDPEAPRHRPAIPLLWYMARNVDQILSI